MAGSLWLWLCPGHRRRLKLARDMDTLAEGDFEGRLEAGTYGVLNPLADRINRWASLLVERRTSSFQQQQQEQAILGAMVEGVLAVDHEHHVMHLNAAAAHLLEIAVERASGRLLEELVRLPELHRLAERVQQTGLAAESEVTWHGAKPRILQVRASPLRHPRHQQNGVVLVLHDITTLRRLERVQRDFVANVSHEFKTPLTSLKGFVETLQEGALDHPADARRFVGIMGRQVERLQSLVEDVLSLSRLEQEAGLQPPPRQEHALRAVLLNAVDTCAPAAASKRITVELACDQQARALINAPMVEQAAINLLDNAIKYSEAETRVAVQVSRENGHWRLAFRDQGPGIDAQHLPHLFERFYRVDKARSRKAGGTGLGLSIVRHIALAHGGQVEVQSEPGRGSSFFLLLPAHAASA